MRKNWREVPRDPIADDDVLEYLYNRSKAQFPSAVDKKADSSAVADNFQGRKKQPGSVRKSWSLKKLFS